MFRREWVVLNKNKAELVVISSMVDEGNVNFLKAPPLKGGIPSDWLQIVYFRIVLRAFVNLIYL